MTQPIYEASVYSVNVEYRNFKGAQQKAELNFALDPIQLLQIFAGLDTRPNKKSGNPARRQETGLSEEGQIKMIRDIAEKAAGFPSDDGESWEPLPDFGNTIAGKTFMTRLITSDEDRREFSEKVIIAPMRAFVAYAKEDPSNSKAEIADLEKTLSQVENIFKVPDPNESIEDRRARLAAEMAELEASSGAN